MLTSYNISFTTYNKENKLYISILPKLGVELLLIIFLHYSRIFQSIKIQICVDVIKILSNLKNLD